MGDLELVEAVLFSAGKPLRVKDIEKLLALRKRLYVQRSES